MGSWSKHGRIWWKENPRRELIQGQISFHSLDHDIPGKTGVKDVSLLVLP